VKGERNNTRKKQKNDEVKEGRMKNSIKERKEKCLKNERERRNKEVET
jgi:hypothetical protein